MTLTIFLRFFSEDWQKQKSLFDTIKNITPTPGGSDKSVDIIVGYNSTEPIQLTQEVRKKINMINPTKKGNPCVDWENSIFLNGYV